MHGRVEEQHVSRQWCGRELRRGESEPGTADGKLLHVSMFIPDEGVVTADQFVEWVILADRDDPDQDPDKWRPIKDAVRAAFVKHMGGEVVDARALRWED